MIAKGRYVKGGAANSASAAVDRRDAVNDVMDHTSRSVSYHKIVLSPSDDEPIQDWREWTRDVMADLEAEQGKELHWYAVHHTNTEHEHVHVVIAGAGEDFEIGQEEAVKLYPQDYQLLRESGHEHSDHDFYHQLDDLLKELDRQDDVGHGSVVRDLERDLSNNLSLALDFEGDHDR